ncbi:Fibronectin [Trichinella pseudospiralis]
MPPLNHKFIQEIFVSSLAHWRARWRAATYQSKCRPADDAHAERRRRMRKCAVVVTSTTSGIFVENFKWLD